MKLKNQGKVALNVVAQACDLASKEAQTRGLEVQSLPGIHNKFNDSLDNLVIPCLQNKNV